MVQKAGYILKYGQKIKRARQEIVANCMLFGLYSF